MDHTGRLFGTSTEGLRERAQRGVLQNVVGRGVTLVLYMASLTVLARLLTPADFGLVGMVTPLIAIVVVLADFGLAQALAQQIELNEGQASAIFRVNMLAGIALTLVFLIASPGIGYMYHESRVVPISAALAFTFLIVGFTSVQRA